MATFSGKNSGLRGASLRGKYMVDVYRGQMRVRAWPRKRGKITNPVTLAQMEWFRQANLLAKYAAPNDIARAIELTAGTPILTRDILLSAMAGRLFQINIAGGKALYPVAARKDVSASLDILAQTPGSMLVRDVDFWVPIQEGDAGDALVSRGPGVIPHWAAAVSASGVGPFTQPVAADFTTVKSTIANYRITDTEGGVTVLSDQEATSPIAGFIGQVLPSAPWTVTTKMWIPRMPENGNFWIGLGVQPTGLDDCVYIGRQVASTTLVNLRISARNAANWSTAPATPNFTGISNPFRNRITSTSENVWYRAKFDGTTLILEYSLDGIQWIELANATLVSLSWPDIIEAGFFTYMNSQNSFVFHSSPSFEIS